MALANRVVHRYLAPVIVRFTGEILTDLRADLAGDSDHSAVFLGRDGLAMRMAARELDPEFTRNKTRYVVASRHMVAAAVADLEQTTGNRLDLPDEFRYALRRVDPADVPDA